MTAIKNNIPDQPIRPQKSGLAWLLIIAVFFCLLLTYTWVRTQSTHTITRISEARETLAKKRAYKKALIVERERLKSDERITKIARTRLNLSIDTSGQTIYFFEEDI